MSAAAVPSPLPSKTRGRPSRSTVDTTSPGADWLVPASMTGDPLWRRKSSVTLVEAPQLASSLKAWDAVGKAGVKVRTFAVVFTAMIVRVTPSLLYSTTWLTWYRDAIRTATVVVVPPATVTSANAGACT